MNKAASKPPAGAGCTISEHNDTIADMHAELAELERKIIPLLNKIRAMQQKPPVIVPKSQDWWK